MHRIRYRKCRLVCDLFQNNVAEQGYIPDHRECREYAADLEPRIDPEERPQKGRRERAPAMRTIKRRAGVTTT